MDGRIEEEEQEEEKGTNHLGLLPQTVGTHARDLRKFAVLTARVIGNKPWTNPNRTLVTHCTYPNPIKPNLF